MREGTVHFLEGTAYEIHTPIPGARGVIFSSFGGAAASKAGISHEKKKSAPSARKYICFCTFVMPFFFGARCKMCFYFFHPPPFILHLLASFAEIDL